MDSSTMSNDVGRIDSDKGKESLLELLTEFSGQMSLIDSSLTRFPSTSEYWKMLESKEIFQREKPNAYILRGCR